MCGSMVSIIDKCRLACWVAPVLVLSLAGASLMVFDIFDIFDKIHLIKEKVHCSRGMKKISKKKSCENYNEKINSQPVTSITSSTITFIPIVLIISSKEDCWLLICIADPSTSNTDVTHYSTMFKQTFT